VRRRPLPLLKSEVLWKQEINYFFRTLATTFLAQYVLFKLSVFWLARDLRFTLLSSHVGKADLRQHLKNNLLKQNDGCLLNFAFMHKRMADCCVCV